MQPDELMLLWVIGPEPWQWILISSGSTYYGEASSENLGNSVAVSGDGTRFGIGIPFRDMDGVTESGQVVIYEWNGVGYSQMGDPVRGGTSWRYGTTLAMSGDGQTFATSGSNTGIQSGVVQAYECINSTWVTKGSYIQTSGGGAKKLFGSDVAINHNGTIIAIGCAGCDGPNAINEGRLEVWEWNNGTSSWARKGNIIHGGDVSTSSFGLKVSISSDGSVIAGTPGARVLEFNGTHWVWIDSVSGYDQISLSPDGLTVAGSASWRIYPYRRDNASVTEFERMVTEITGQSGDGIAFSYDGNSMAVSHPLGFYEWDGTTWDKRDSIGSYDSERVALSYDGKVLVAGHPGDDTAGTNAGSARVYHLTYPPTAAPTTAPTAQPSASPSAVPTADPSASPSAAPSYTPCPAGMFVSLEVTGDSIISTCLMCPPGTVSEFGSDTCTVCPAGTFASPLSSECEVCPVGYFSIVKGASSCTKCPPGSAASADSTHCTPCVHGSYSTAATTDCDLCPAGSFSATGAAECTTCSTGSVSASNSSFCTFCTAGTYANTIDNTCDDCQPGYYSSIGASSCTVCPAGSSSFGGAAGCVPCPAGTYSGTLMANCDECSAGYFSSTGSTECTMCPTGTMSAANSSSCTQCPAGKFANSIGAECKQCSPGHYSQGGAATCTVCPAGTIPAADQSICVACPTGEYSIAGSTVCSNCTTDIV